MVAGVLVSLLSVNAVLAQQLRPLNDVVTANTPQSLSDTGEPSEQADEPLLRESPIPTASAPSSEPGVVPGTSASGSTSVPAGSPTHNILQLNKAIAIFNDNLTILQDHYNERQKARGILEALCGDDPSQTTCQYYLGLIDILDGIYFSDMSVNSQEGRDVEPEDNSDRQDKSPKADGYEKKAQDAFKSARDRFQKLIDADKKLRTTEGGLYLGISQLALDEGQEGKESGASVPQNEKAQEEALKQQIKSGRFRENSLEAEKILAPYVESEDGKDDPYGRFFLGIARFRLGVHYKFNGKDADYKRYHKLATKDFEDSQILAGRAGVNGSEYALDSKTFGEYLQYYSGLICAIGSDRGGAEKSFRPLIEGENVPERLSLNASKILKKLEEQPRSTIDPTMSTRTPLGLLSLEGKIGMGNFYDSNVILLGKNQPLPYGITKKDDYKFGLDSGLDATLYADNATMEENNWLGKSLLVGVGGQTNNMWQPSINEYQINLYNGRAYLNYEPFDDLYLGLRYDYSWALLGSEPFYGSHRIIPSISYVWRKDFERSNEELTRTDIYYLNDYRTYHDDIPDYRFDRTGEYQAFGVTQTLNIATAETLWHDYYNNPGLPDKEKLDCDRWSRVWIGYNYRDEQTKGTEFDLAGDQLVLGFEIPLPKRLMFDFAAAWSWDDYDNPSALDYRGNARHDMIQDYQWGLTYIIIAKGEYLPWKSLEMKVRGSIQAIMEDSNIWNRQYEEAYTYNRNIYGLQLFINF